MDEQTRAAGRGVRAGTRADRSPSSWPATTARDSAITAKRCTATSSTSPPCSCRWSIAGPGVPAAVSDAPVSTRRVFHTLLDWAGLDAAHSLRKPRLGGRGGRGDEAVPRVRLAAAGDGGRRPPQVDPRGARRDVRRASPTRGETRDLAADDRSAATRAGRAARLPDPVARRHRVRRRTSTRRRRRRWRASGTSARARRPWCARTRRGPPT